MSEKLPEQVSAIEVTRLQLVLAILGFACVALTGVVGITLYIGSVRADSDNHARQPWHTEAGETIRQAERERTELRVTQAHMKREIESGRRTQLNFFAEQRAVNKEVLERLGRGK